MQEGASPVPLFSHRTQKGNVKREAPRVVSTAQSSRQHRGGLCPPSLSANYSPVKIVFLARGDVLMGPGLGVRTDPVHTHRLEVKG